MPRYRVLALAILVLAACRCWPAAGQDNPILRERLEQKIIEDLAKHNTQETAWFNKKSVDRQKWTDGKLLGRKIRLASWTEQSKTWLWLEEPNSTLSLDLTHLAIRAGRLEFSATAKAKANFKAWGRIPKLAQAAVGGNVRAVIQLEGSAAIGAGRLENSQITTFHVVLEDLQFNNPAAGPMEDLAKDALNDYMKDKNEKLRRSMEKAIDRVKF